MLGPMTYGVLSSGASGEVTPWHLAGGAIDEANVLEVVSYPDIGQAYAGDSVVSGQPWSLVFYTRFESEVGAYMFDSATGRFIVGNDATANPDNNGIFTTDSGWVNIGLFPVDSTYRAYFIISDGSSIQAYRENVAVGSAITSNEGIGGNTLWGRHNSLLSLGWLDRVPGAAIYNVALDAAQRNALFSAMPGGDFFQAINGTLVSEESILEWFQKPASVRFVGTHDRTYISWIEHSGVIQIRYYDHGTQAWSSIVTVDDLTDVSALQAVDDHNGPQMTILPDGTIQLYYAIHDTIEAFYMKEASSVEDISAWGSRQTIADAGSSLTHNYPQVKRVSNGDLHLFYRRGAFNNAKEYVKVSDDSGATWGSPTLLIDHGTDHGVYAFVVNSGDEIHVAWNDHSGGDRLNIYYMYSDNAGITWKKRDGTAITLPVTEATADLVFDSGALQAYAWDIRLDGSNNPYIVFAHKGDPNHEFRYAWYAGGWQTAGITASKQLYNGNNFYSGGIVIDPADVSAVYLSKLHSIEKWVTADGGSTWSKDSAVTTNNALDNFRPQVIENNNGTLKLIWCYGNYVGLVTGDWTGWDEVDLYCDL